MYLITAALPYANGPLHIGHLAGVYLPADIYTRYLRLKNKKVLFVCGSDEHGAAITIKAKKENTTPKNIVDKFHKINKQSFIDFNISFDIYSRTSSNLHHKIASEFFLEMYKKGLFEEIESDQFYDEKEKIFLADRYIIGTCPKCEFEEAYGDQCENCGSTLNPNDLINPSSSLSGTSPILKKTKHWFLPLNKYESWLAKWILTDHKKDWKPNVYGQCKSWIEDGLKPRAVTRDIDWGVKVPLKNAEGKVLYVWFDAPIGYISATQEWAKSNNSDWEKIWTDKNTKLIHFIGKDNIVFHCIIFPIMLKAHGKYILPENVPANEFMNLEGKKLSTSKNWAIWLPDFIKKFPDKKDVLRYVLCSNTPETKDSDFKWIDFINKNNNELVAIVGNFINRTLVLTKKYFDYKVPNISSFSDIDKSVINNIANIPNKISDSLEKYKFREAIFLWVELARIGNKYLADTEPWKISNNSIKKNIIYVALQIVANISILGLPFLPDTCKNLQKMLNIKINSWKNIGGSIEILPENHVLSGYDLLFSKIDNDVTMGKM